MIHVPVMATRNDMLQCTSKDDCKLVFVHKKIWNTFKLIEKESWENLEAADLLYFIAVCIYYSLI